MNKKDLFKNYTIGENAYEEVSRVCSIYGNKVVLIGGKTALEKAEKAIKNALKESEIEVAGTFWYGGEAAYENVEALKREKVIREADMIFAVGGGKAIDTCKVLSEQLKKPLFTFPTIASTCASITSVCAMYNKDGSFRDLFWKSTPPNHVFINTKVIAEAPEVYLWAGIGDTLAKGYEPEFSSRGRCLDYSNTLGVALSSQCQEPLVKYGRKALQDCRANKSSTELEEVVLSIIITTGMVSNYVVNDYNSCVAHAICYGFSRLKEVEENHLHGELVSYGVLVQLMLDKNVNEIKKLLSFYKEIDLPVSYKNFKVTEEQMKKVAEAASKVNDVKAAPFEITEELLYDAVIKLETVV